MTAPSAEPTVVPAPPSHRGGVTLSDKCWSWLRVTADRDGTTRDHLLDGLVLLAMDDERATT